jgi:hypothetical protein
VVAGEELKGVREDESPLVQAAVERWWGLPAETLWGE